MNIAHLFENAAQQWPERTAIIDKDGRAYSYKTLRQLVVQQVEVFSKKGIVQGDRVMVFIPMSIELYITVLALFYKGATAVFLDEWVNKERLELCCRIAKCKGFIAPFKIRAYALLSKELRKIDCWLPLPKTQCKEFSNEVSLCKVNTEETALITFTTGSTGIPKAANRTHGFLRAQFNALEPLTLPLPEHPQGPDMPMLPIVLLINLGRGVTSVIADFKASQPKAFQPERIWQQIQKHSVVSLTTSPYFAEQIGKCAPENIPLKKMMIGGGALLMKAAEKLNLKLPSTAITIVYGSTEAEPISHIALKDLLLFYKDKAIDKGLLVGYADASTEVCILPFDYQPEEPFNPYGEPLQAGEICVSGNHVLQGYIDNPEAELQNKIWVGNQCWHRTGDAGLIDKEGRIFLLGRCKQVINYKEAIYYPFLAENYIQTLPGVVNGTLIKKDEKLFVVIQTANQKLTKATEDAILFKWPESNIVVVKEMPMDARHHTKIDYEKLWGGG